jgi:hypothetical protein
VAKQKLFSRNRKNIFGAYPGDHIDGLGAPLNIASRS